MTDEQEVLLLCDRFHGDFWLLHPEIHDLVGWWPDGSPAWADEPDCADERIRVLDVIPRRKPVDDDWVEDHPSVTKMIDLVMTLNDILVPWRDSAIAAAHAARDPYAQADAVHQRILRSFADDEVLEILNLATDIERARKQHRLKMRDQ